MRRFLLFISFCFMLLMPIAATEIVEDFSTNIWELPTSSQGTGKGTFTSTTGYTYNASWATGCYWYNSKCLMLGKSGSYIEFPAFEGTVTKVEVLNSSGCSTNVSVKITDNNGDEIVAAQQFKTTSKTYTYEIPTEKQVEGQVLRLVVTNKYNVQISKITITVESTGGGGGTGTTVAAPTVSAEYNVVTLACTADGATIYYTTDGTEPTAASTEYTAPFTITGPTTVKAIAITSEGSSNVTTEKVTYYITKMSEFNTIADATGYKVHLTDATVAYQDGDKKRIFLFDGENGILIFSNTALATTYNPGDVIATVEGDLTIYNNLPEITNASLGEKKEGIAPTPVEATFEDFTYANSNKYVIIKNVTFNKRAKTATFSDGKELTVFSSNGMTHPGNGVYNIIGFVNIFKGTTIEIDAIEFVAKSLSFSTNSVTMTYGDAIPEFKLENPAGLALTWSSSDVNVATVDADGKVTVVGVGATTIKAAETGNEEVNYATIEFTVSPAAGNISYFANKFVVLKDADFVAPVLTNPNGLTVTYASDNEDVLVDENTGDVVIYTSVADVTATITATAAAQGNYAESVASYTIVVKEAGSGSGTGEKKQGELTATGFNATTSYSNVTYNDEVNGISYGAVIMTNAAKEFIQINNNGKVNGTATDCGIFVTKNTNNMVIRKITVNWHSSTAADRTLNVYGSNDPYTSASDLWADGLTTIGTMYHGTAESTTFEITDADYSYFGLRVSKSGAMYISSITLEWEGAAAGAPTFSATLSLSTETEGGESANVLSLSGIKGSVDLAGKNVYLNDRNICGADASADYLPYLADGVFTVVDGTTAYALNATLPNLSAITAKVTKVAYKAWKDNDHLISEGMWYLDAEYTVAADTEMELVADFYFEGNAGREGHVKSVNGNTAYVEGIGYFTVTSTTGSDGKTHDVYEYITDAAGDFMVTPQFPFFVKSGMSDMIKAPEGTSRIVAINGAPVVVEVENLAEQPSAEGGNVSGVESVVVDSEGAVEYYNLQGVRVEGALTPGIYIRRTATGTSKVAIR